MNPVLVDVLRGASLESSHRGALAVLDADGALPASLGDIDRPIFPRSAVKLLQALPLVESGAAERLGLNDDELALACASHSGEELHVRTAASMLAKAGLDFTALECGTHWPSLDKAARALAAAGREPTALHNNCSGKHSGILCLASMQCGGVDLKQYVKAYVSPEHSVMRSVTAALQTVTGFDPSTAPRGMDGCSIPTYGIALRRLAIGFARVGTGVCLSEGHARAAQRLRRAIAYAPFMVAGTGRFDTRVMQQMGERVCCKVGAEGVFCAALPGRGLGVAIKIDDGNNARAAEVVMASVLEASLRPSGADAEILHSLCRPTLRNWNGIDVGQLRPAAALTSLRLH
ncbi:MAG: asparaginase [Burkholderiaceae bacterium]